MLLMALFCAAALAKTTAAASGKDAPSVEADGNDLVLAGENILIKDGSHTGVQLGVFLDKVCRAT